MPAKFKAGGTLITTGMAGPVILLQLFSRSVKGGGRPFKISIPYHPKFGPGVDGGKFTQGTGGVLVSQSAVDACQLQCIASLGDDNTIRVGINQLHRRKKFLRAQLCQHQSQTVLLVVKWRHRNRVGRL